MTDERLKWEARARRQVGRDWSEAQHDYAARRAARLAQPYERECEVRGLPVKCGCPKWRGVRWYECRQHLTCARCRIARAKRLGSRMAAALEHRLAESPKGYHIVMMTIALRHSGDVARDRVELALAWERYRKSFHARWGQFDYVGTFEVTPGRDGAGHVHAHMVCLWPWGYPGSGEAGDWSKERALWLAAAQGRSEVVFFKASENARDAAWYVSKYVAKGVTSSEFSPVLAAKVCGAMYGKRWLLSSEGFWLKTERVCPCCGERVRCATVTFEPIDAPPVDPGQRWRDWRERWDDAAAWARERWEQPTWDMN